MWGEIDQSVFDRVEAEASAHLDALDGPLEIDTSRVSFMNVAGVRLLARAAAAAPTVTMTSVSLPLGDMVQLGWRPELATEHLS